jgi:hypothetical protein
LTYAKQLPHLVPGYVDVGKMGHDLYIGEQLEVLLSRISSLVCNMEDTRLLFYEEAFEASRNIYQSLRNASRNNIRQATDAVEDLKQHFPRTGKTTKKSKEKLNGTDHD